MALVEVRLSGIDLSVSELDQLEAHLLDLYEYEIGGEIRSDVRLNLWEPYAVYGGELDVKRQAALMVVVLDAIRAVSGPLSELHEPRAEFVIHPETAREELQKQIADHRFQLEERQIALSRYAEDPATADMLLNEIDNLNILISDLETQLANWPED